MAASCFCVKPLACLACAILLPVAAPTVLTVEVISTGLTSKTTYCDSLQCLRPAAEDRRLGPSSCFGQHPLMKLIQSKRNRREYPNHKLKSGFKLEFRDNRGEDQVLDKNSARIKDDVAADKNTFFHNGGACWPCSRSCWNGSVHTGARRRVLRFLWLLVSHCRPAVVRHRINV